jgi:hypothetical protein
MGFAQRSRDDGGLGLAPHQAAGVVGNLMSESGGTLTPWGPTGDNGSAWGTAQWRGDRLSGLKSFAEENGLDHRSVDAQQRWMRREFDTTEGKSYAALNAAKTPEEAATAMNRHYERSADNTGQREANARSLMERFGGSTPALSYARTGAPVADNTQPALSSAAQVGDGVLDPGVAYGGGMRPQSRFGDTMDGITRAMATLASGTNPEQSAAMTAGLKEELAGRVANSRDSGSYTMHVDPKTGMVYKINSKTGRLTQAQGQEPQDPAAEAYKTSEAKRFSELNGTIAADAQKSQASLGSVDTLRGLLKSPDVMQGPGAETANSLKKIGNTYFGMDFKGVAESDTAVALMNKMTQESRNLNGGMPGSLSDRDLKFLEAANPSLNKSPEANQRILDIYEKLHRTAIDRNAARIEYTKGGKQLDDNFNTLQQKTWADKHAPDNAAFKAEQAVPAAAAVPAANLKPIKTSTGVTWTRN